MFVFVLFYFVVINIYFLTSLHTSCMGWHLCSDPHSPKNARPILRRRYQVVIMGHAHTDNNPIGLWSEDGTRIDCLRPAHSLNIAYRGGGNNQREAPESQIT